MLHPVQLADPTLLRSDAFVDGKWCKAASGAGLEVRDPASGESLARVPCLDASEVRSAIAAAERAGPDWRGRSAAERAALLRRWHSLVVENSDDLAQLLTREQGKPLAEARGEIAYAASFIDWFAEEARRVYGETIPETRPDTRILVTREPVGVVAAITPWNFPAAMITRKLAPALAAGCTAVVKPSEEAPLSALALAELAHRAGIPAGVLNVVTGDPALVGGELTSNPSVRKLSFTGSTAVGRLLMQQCAPTLKRLSLELGGNAPFLVFDDADLEAAIEGAIASKFRNSGQTCVCANRFLVEDAMHDRFVEALASRVSELRVGHGLEPGVEQGPLINPEAVAKVERLLGDALASGAQVHCGGSPHALGGTWFEPTVVSGVRNEMPLAREEVFGPVAPVLRFSDEQEAVAIANDTPAGLAAYLYTRDLGRAWWVSGALEYGIVGVNEGIISSEVAPFGGVKQSGLGREGSHLGIDEYLEVKYTLMGGLGA